jgi:ABC-type multidrug transport system fused ATPase/permease subunit
MLQARAIYTDADVYLFDDPLSALDASVAKKVFEGAIHNHLRHKARVLVTNQVQFALQADRVLVLKGGVVVEKGAGTQVLTLLTLLILLTLLTLLTL